ncbi:MAG: hypothetical protein WC554_06735 [Clostridia bacterium]
MPVYQLLKCPKCGGKIMTDGEEKFCLNCGWVPVNPVKEPVGSRGGGKW